MGLFEKKIVSVVVRECDVERNDQALAASPKPLVNHIDRSSTSSATTESKSDGSSDTSITVSQQIERESRNSIQYRTCSWQKTAALLFATYICLAIMSFPASYAALGLVPGLICTFVIAAMTQYTSLLVWKFCLRHPEVKDVCDIAQILFGGCVWVWWVTAVMFILNNTFIQALHVLVGGKYLNTVSNHGACTIAFAVVVSIISWTCSLPRTFKTLSSIATFSALFTFVSLLLATVFASIQDHPAGYPVFGKTLEVLAWPPPTTTFVIGYVAFLNISYTFLGQIALPSFIAEMKDPNDFPKALWTVMICEILLVGICGTVMYVHFGTNYVTSPAFASLQPKYELIAFSFMVPSLIFLGVLYASVSARFIFFNVFGAQSEHKTSNTLTGWSAWAGILAALWVFAFVIAEVIPFFNDLLSLMSSLFDSFFGFIFWGVAYCRMRRADYGPEWYRARGLRSIVELAFNICLIGVGLLFLTAGTYVSLASIVIGYKEESFGGAFTCADTSL